MSFVTLTLILFLIMDPIGNIASYLSVTKDVERNRSWKILAREMIFALAIMVTFNFIGELLFDILKLSEVTVKIAAGLILFLFALQILFPTLNSIRQNLPKGEPFLIPLAMPLIASPSLLATIMLFARTEESQLLMLGAILVAWIGAFIILASSHFLFKILGSNGLIACEKLMGMVLILLAIQRFMDGIKQFLETNGTA